MLGSSVPTSTNHTIFMTCYNPTAVKSNLTYSRQIHTVSIMLTSPYWIYAVTVLHRDTRSSVVSSMICLM
ncbi:Uncharacterised protein [Vibrio cholerae]|nr:Uncharacterised protein [Vibrio cholerae]CSI61627.1 Uncharacterised protein [Vibrio cholerae]